MNLYEISLYREDLERTYEAVISVEKLKKKNILITGATGLVGSFLVDFLIYCNEEKGMNCEIYAAARDQIKFGQRFKNHCDKPYLHFLPHNLQDRPEWEDSFDYIIHCAGDGRPESFVRHPSKTLLEGVTGTEALLNYGMKCGAKCFLLVSSGEVYGLGSANMLEFREEYSGGVDSMNPRSCYPIAKKAEENLCASYSKQFGLHTVVARLCHTYGPTALPEDGRVASSFVRDVLMHRDIVMKSGGEQLRSWCYIADSASGILSILLEGRIGEAYNVSNRLARSSIREMARAVADIGQCRLIEECPDEEERRAFNPMTHGVLAPDKLEALGWSAQYDLTEGFAHTLNILEEAVFTDMVSVIIPVYNVELYLEHCLESVTRQTYRNLEILLIDDGSTDNSLKLCRKWERKDKRITVFSKANEGLGPTRNFGIRKANGNYLAFVDSDDWVKEDFIEALLVALRENDADMAFCDYSLMLYDSVKGSYTEKSGRRYLCLEGSTNLLKTPELLSRMSSVTWNKIVKKELIWKNKIMQSAKGFEDTVYAWSILSNASKIVHVRKQLYFYWINRSDSLTNRSTPDDVFMSIDDAVKVLPDYEKNHDFQIQVAKYTSGLLGIPLTRLIEDRRDTYATAKDNYYCRFPESKKIDNIKILLMGSSNLTAIFKRVRFMNQKPEKSLISMPCYWDTEIMLDFLEKLEIEDKIKKKPIINENRVLFLDLWSQKEHLLGSRKNSWRHGLSILAQYLLSYFAEDKIFIVDSRLPLGYGRYQIESLYENYKEREKANLELKEAVSYLKTLLKRAVYLSPPEAKMLFSEDESDELLNNYWYYDIADNIRRRL